MYDARFGRWLSPDPYGQFASPYVGMGNNPVSGVDPNGGWCCGGGGSAIEKGLTAPAGALGAAAEEITTFTLDELVFTGAKIASPGALQSFSVVLPGLTGLRLSASDIPPVPTPTTQQMYDLFKGALIRIGQADAEERYVKDHWKNGDVYFGNHYGYDPLRQPHWWGWRRSRETKIKESLGSRNIYGPWTMDQDSGVPFYPNYLADFAGVANGVIRYSDLSGGAMGGTANFVGGPTISLGSLTDGGLKDQLTFAFKSIHDRDVFFNRYYKAGWNHQMAYMERTYPIIKRN